VISLAVKYKKMKKPSLIHYLNSTLKISHGLQTGETGEDRGIKFVLEMVESSGVA